MQQINKYLFCFILVLGVVTARSQNAIFLCQGTVSFEKRTNTNFFLKEEFEEGSPFYNSYKEKYPDFSISHFYLHFNQKSSYYSPEIEKEPGMLNFIEKVAGSNEVVTDFAADSLYAKKNVLGQQFNIATRRRNISWKMTDEVRTIAGFKCHRVNAVVLDSLYVIAYYTDQIPVPGGPESFNGLPGMILGLAIPRLHSTWFATQVSIVDGRNLVKENLIKTNPNDESSFFAAIGRLLDAKSKSYGREVLQAKL
jgi:GLPGLI family protein